MVYNKVFTKKDADTVNGIIAGAIDEISSLPINKKNALFEIRVILSELIINAIKYGCKNGPITVKVESDDHTAVISVKDCGKGFDPSKINYNEDSLMNESGRGLVIVKKLCQKLSFNKKGNSITAVYDLYE